MNDLLFGAPIIENNVTIDMLGDDLKKRGEIRKSRDTNEEIDTAVGTDAALAMLLSRIHACQLYAQDFISDENRDPRAHGLADASKVMLNTLNGTSFKDVVNKDVKKYTHFSPTAVQTKPDPETQLLYKHKESEVEIQLLAIDIICPDSLDSTILIRHLANGDLEVIDKAKFEECYAEVKPSPRESPAELQTEETGSEASLEASSSEDKNKKKKKNKRKQVKKSRRDNR